MIYAAPSLTSSARLVPPLGGVASGRCRSVPRDVRAAPDRSKGTASPTAPHGGAAAHQLGALVPARRAPLVAHPLAPLDPSNPSELAPDPSMRSPGIAPPRCSKRSSWPVERSARPLQPLQARREPFTGAARRKAHDARAHLRDADPSPLVPSRAPASVGKLAPLRSVTQRIDWAVWLETQRIHRGFETLARARARERAVTRRPQRACSPSRLSNKRERYGPRPRRPRCMTHPRAGVQVTCPRSCLAAREPMMRARTRKDTQ